MSEVALLNPQVESDGMRSLIDLARTRRDAESQKLLTTELEHNDYLKTFGAVTALTLLIDDMQTTYDRKVHR